MADELKKPEGASLEEQKELPVVTRLVIEIRSDGTRTIARGMAEDVAQGERVQIKAEGATPLQLVLSLVKSLRDVPVLTRGDVGFKEGHADLFQGLIKMDFGEPAFATKVLEHAL